MKFQSFSIEQQMARRNLNNRNTLMVDNKHSDMIKNTIDQVQIVSPSKNHNKGMQMNRTQQIEINNNAYSHKAQIEGTPKLSNGLKIPKKSSPQPPLNQSI